MRYMVITIGLLCLANPSAAQQQSELEKKITMSGTNITIGRAMSDIENQTSYSFAFNMGQLDTGTPVKFSSRDLTTLQALAQMFGEGKFKYVIRSRFIAVSPNDETAQRANVVARDADHNLVTVDTLVQGESIRVKVQTTVEFEEEPYEIERIVTIIPGEEIVRNYPSSYSSYLPLKEYSGFENRLPFLGVKVNLLYGAVLFTPNIAVELGVKPKHTIELSGSYSWRGRKSAASLNHKQSAHWIVRPEYRWWFCERFDGHYLGAHALFSKYYISGKSLPLLFKKQYSYDGWAAGAGVTYGYNWAFAKRWGLDFNIGVGYAYMKYNRGTCVKCDPQPVSTTKHYFGPTRAGINLVFLIR